ncbi:TonB-dependent receptor domain-containing protein [Sunxiuqinia elliptica]|uniref:Outer membrane receptor proteins, mostly Fe transport n=1 Tax=Sunxiuqinia elliptica TaxID=655355 RepID=A0A1I2M7S7_9BACT|nr:TonB-dependent receptor [Sunxiuqinia elliptica]SFF85241.1 Outer membrane receptor proteins, mostly Fe transport [Sunxiuqinia elliptica]
MNIHKTLIIFFLFAHLAVVAQPPEATTTQPSNKATIKGQIIDADTKQHMEYANISLFNPQDSSLVTGSITDVQGEFVIRKINFGTYYAEANFIGFNKLRINNIRINSSNREIDLGVIELQPSTQEIGTVSVVADRSRVQYKIDKKVVNVSQDINAAGGTAVDVLENTPSVEVDIEGNVSLRGSSSFTVLIDGKPSVLEGSDALRQLPASVIENIEIITNPSAKYDPDGMAGIINIVMKKNVLSGFNGIINAMVGTRDKYRTDLTLNYKTKKSNLFFGADFNDETFYGSGNSYRETYLTDTTRYLISDGNRDFGRSGHRFKGGVDLYLTDLSTLTLSGTYGEYGRKRGGTSRLHEYTAPANEEIFSIEDENSKREGTYVSTNINFQQKFDESGKHKLDALFYYSNSVGDDYEYEDEFYTDSNYQRTEGYLARIKTLEEEDEDEYRIELDYTRPVGDDGRFEAGFQSRIDREYESYSFNDWDNDLNDYVDNPEFSSSQNFKRDIVAGYSTFANKVGSFSYQLGLRGEYTNRSIAHEKAERPAEINRFDLFPTLHFSYEFLNRLQLMTSYSRRIDRPNGRDLDPFPNYYNRYTIRYGNPELEPEYTDSYELGIMKNYGKSFISLEGFYRVTNNLITQVTELGDDGIFYINTENLNNDYSLGSEIMGNLNIKDWLIFNGSFSLYRYRIEGEVLGESIDRKSTNYTGRLNTTVKLNPNSRIQMTGYYRGPSVSAQGDRSDFFFTNLSYRQDLLKKKLTATLSLRDVFGTMKFERTSSGVDFSDRFKRERESQVVTLTLSYKLNNFKLDRGSNGNGVREMDFDDGGF